MKGTDWKTIEFADCVEEMLDDDPAGTYRRIFRNVARRFFESTHRRQRRMLNGPVPRLSGTKWDALLAATVEYAAEIDGHAPPAWTQEPERFLETPWSPLCDWAFVEEDAWCPAAFIRHGAIPDPRDFDSRCGYLTDWEPDEA